MVQKHEIIKYDKLTTGMFYVGGSLKMYQAVLNFNMKSWNWTDDWMYLWALGCPECDVFRAKPTISSMPNEGRI